MGNLVRENGTAGQRIRSLLESATECVEIIAPFVKTKALHSLLEMVRDDVHVRCVTRWLPKEVAAGVSDLEVFDVLEERGNSELVLVDRLHAKLYIADEECLVGSANTTLSGFGEARDSNVEVLVESVVADTGVRAALNEIKLLERSATRSTLEAVRRLADSLPAAFLDEGGTWFPTSRQPLKAYRFYKNPPREDGRVSDRLLMQDVARANLPPELSEVEFNEEIRALLAAMPIAKEVLAATDDRTFTRTDAYSYLATKEGEFFTVNDLWLAFVKWMSHFYADKLMEQEITEIALRSAQVLKM